MGYTNNKSQTEREYIKMKILIPKTLNERDEQLMRETKNSIQILPGYINKIYKHTNCIDDAVVVETKDSGLYKVIQSELWDNIALERGIIGDERFVTDNKFIEISHKELLSLNVPIKQMCKDLEVVSSKDANRIVFTFKGSFDTNYRQCIKQLSILLKYEPSIDLVINQIYTRDSKGSVLTKINDLNDLLSIDISNCETINLNFVMYFNNHVGYKLNSDIVNFCALNRLSGTSYRQKIKYFRKEKVKMFNRTELSDIDIKIKNLFK